MNPATTKAVIATAVAIMSLVLRPRSRRFRHKCLDCCRRQAEWFLVRHPLKSRLGHRYRRLFCMQCWANRAVRRAGPKMRARWDADIKANLELLRNGVPRAREKRALWP